jgi:hypothetical protein
LEEYHLKDIALKDFKLWAKNLGIEHFLHRTTKIDLKKISPESVCSNHIVIAISGFLTEDVDKKYSWRHIVNHYKYSEVFALSWNSLSISNFFNEGYLKGRRKKNVFEKAISIVGIGKK